MAKKMTKRDYFNTLLNLEEVKANTALTDFVKHELDLLAKKNSGEKKPTATQKQNEVIKTAIYESMEDEKRYLVSDFIKNVPECAELSNQKVAALVRQLVNEGKLYRFEEKRKAYFSLN